MARSVSPAKCRSPFVLDVDLLPSHELAKELRVELGQEHGPALEVAFHAARVVGPLHGHPGLPKERSVGMRWTELVGGEGGRSALGGSRF